MIAIFSYYKVEALQCNVRLLMFKIARQERLSRLADLAPNRN